MRAVCFSLRMIGRVRLHGLLPADYDFGSSMLHSVMRPAAVATIDSY